MNLFLPYVDDVKLSIRCLDNKRLCKQILECKTMLDIANDPNHTDGYARHPIVKHYTSTKRQIKFLRYYANKCCEEYKFRFGKEHQYSEQMPPTKYIFHLPGYTPIYVEGSKPNQIVTIDHDKVSELYRMKLIKKWNADKYPPKWTKRDTPSFYNNKLEEIEASIKLYNDIRGSKNNDK